MNKICKHNLCFEIVFNLLILNIIEFINLYFVFDALVSEECSIFDGKNLYCCTFRQQYMLTGGPFIKFLGVCKDGKLLTQLHSLIIKTGFIHDSVFATKLINLYSKLAPVKITRKLFDETPNKTVCVWNSIIKCYCKEKQYKESFFLFYRLFSSEQPDHHTISVGLKACAGLKALDFGKIIHGFVNKTDRMGSNLFVGSGLIEMYSKCEKMGDALLVFEEYSKPDTVLWTTVITGYEQDGSPEEALAFFTKMMMVSRVSPDFITLVTVVSACAQLRNSKMGRSVHGYAIKMQCECGLSLLNALLNLYSKTGSVSAAANLFRKMKAKDLISWGSMMACYAHHGSATQALDLFNEMVTRFSEFNAAILISALQACEAACDLEWGKRIHELASRNGLEFDILISTALIDMYMNCSSPDEAIEIFKRIPVKDAVCYASLLCGCIQNGMFHKSIGIFCDMLANGIRPDAVSMVNILTASSESGVLQQTSCIHGLAIRSGLDNKSFVVASLIESYAKCGGLDGSIAVFKETKDRDVVIWSSMFAGYGFHGKGQEALELFNQMIKYSSVRPNEVSFLSTLSACSHAGLVKEGIEVFNLMVNEYQLSPNSKHYGIVVDLLGRIGDLENAMEFINQMSNPVGADVWGALLGACRTYQNMVIGEVAAKKIAKLDPSHAGYYVLLSNLYADDGKWEDVAEVRKLVKQKQLNKVSGQSVIELRDEVLCFAANDRSHEDSAKIYELLTKLQWKMKQVCNICCMETMMYGVDEILT